MFHYHNRQKPSKGAYITYTSLLWFSLVINFQNGLKLSIKNKQKDVGNIEKYVTEIWVRKERGGGVKKTKKVPVLADGGDHQDLSVVKKPVSAAELARS